MEIISVSFEASLLILIKDKMIKLTTLKTQEDDNVKFSIMAPSTINIYRQEIYLAIKQKQLESS